MDLKAYLRLIRFHWVAIVVLMLLGGAVGATVAELQAPVYAAKVQLLVTGSTSGQDSGNGYEGALLAQTRAKSYTTLLTSESVLRHLKADLNLPYSTETLRDHISASNPSDTAVIDVTVKDTSRSRAVRIAAAMGPVFSTAVASAQGPAQPGSASAVRALDGADVLDHPVAPHKALDVTLGLVTGLVLGMAWAIVRELGDRPIRDAVDLTEATDIGLLGEVLHSGARRDDGLGADAAGPGVSDPDAYRWLALSMEEANPGAGPSTRVFATPGPQRDEDTATAVAAGLGAALAETGARVIVVDAGTAGDRVSRFFRLGAPWWNLRDVLEQRVSLGNALRSVREDLPLVVLSGSSGSESAGLAPLRTAAVTELARELERRADVMIFAAPPILNRSDATVLARAVGRAVIVVEAKVTRGRALAEATQRLRSLGVSVEGAVLSLPGGRRQRRRGKEAVGSEPPQVTRDTLSTTAGGAWRKPAARAPMTMDRTGLRVREERP